MDLLLELRDPIEQFFLEGDLRRAKPELLRNVTWPQKVGNTVSPAIMSSTVQQ